MEWVVSILCLAFGMLAGITIAFAISVRRGGVFHPRFDELQRYRSWLGRRCHVKRDGQWIECEVVAVSHKGEIAVKPLTNDAQFWVSKKMVSETVVWL